MTDSILVINCGSSSIKFALYPLTNPKQAIITALAERLGEAEPTLKIRGELNQTQRLDANADHRAALETFTTHCQPWLENLRGIGHRVVHGGERYHASTLLDDETIQALDELSALAPLHNPVNVLGIRLTQSIWPNLAQVAVFDTAFHQTIPESAFLYGVPYEWYQQDGVRRYGFHGTSYRFVTAEAARRLNKDQSDCYFVIAHLGNGCSACAVAHGESVDSSMGLTPLEGLIMGTRSGDIDPGLIEHMQRSRGLSLTDSMHALNRESGLKGLSELSNDMRTLLHAEADGNLAAKRAIDVFCFRVARQFAALSASLPTIDAVIFTGGIGENAAKIRQRIIAAWKFIQFRLDDTLNQQHGDELGRISQPGAPLVMVVATDEEAMIAQDTLDLIQHD